MKQKIVIIGVSYSSRLALARSIGVLNCDITVVAWVVSDNAPLPIDGYSKYVNRVLFCKKEEQAFIRLLKEQCVDSNQKVILVPDCDFSVTMIDMHQEELRPYFLMPHINHTQGAIVKWSNKLQQKELANKIGMNIVPSTVIEIKNARYIIPEDVEYPCFPKALVSVAGGKAGMFRCNNKQELSKALEDIVSYKKVDAKVMVERYMDIEKEYAVLGFSDGENVCIPAVLQFIIGSKAQRGIALQGKVMPVNGFEDILGQFKIFVRKIGLVGLFDIDFYESKGKLYFSELNIRYGGSGYAIVKMGVNLPSMYVDMMSGKTVEIQDKYIKESAIYFNERIAYNDLCNGYISFSEYRRFKHNTDILFVKDEDDKKPYKYFNRMVIVSVLKSMAKRVTSWEKK